MHPAETLQRNKILAADTGDLYVAQDSNLHVGLWSLALFILIGFLVGLLVVLVSGFTQPQAFTWVLPGQPIPGFK